MRSASNASSFAVWAGWFMAPEIKKPVQRAPETGLCARLFSGICFPAVQGTAVGRPQSEHQIGATVRIAHDPQCAQTSADCQPGTPYNAWSFKDFARMEHLEPKATVDFLKRNPDALFVDCRSEMDESQLHPFIQAIQGRKS